MKPNYKNILSSTPCPSSEQLRQYVEGRLSGSEKHAVERHLADCEMCSDEAEGMAMLSGKGRLETITREINKKIDERTGTQKKRQIFADFRLRAAALIIVILGIGSVIYIMVKNQQKNTEIFAEHFTPYENKEQAEPDTDKTKTAEKGTVTDSVEETAPIEEAPADYLAESIETAEEKQKKQKPAKTSSTNKTKTGEDKDKETKELPERSNAIEDKSPGENEETAVMSDMESDVVRDFSGMGATSVRDSASFEDVTSVEDKKDAVYDDYFEPKEMAEEPAMETVTGTTDRKSRSKSGGGVFKKAARAESGAYDGTPAYNPVDTVSLAITAYNSGQYQEAAAMLERVLKKQPANRKAAFYAGVSYLSLEQPEKAIDKLNVAIDDENCAYYESALWYKALALVKLNKKKKAGEILEKIITLKRTYKEKAEEMLEDIE